VTNAIEEKYSVENPFNLHYINSEINEYGNIREFETTTTVSEDATVRTAFIAGNKDENSLTNIIFFKRHPELNKSERLKPHQKELINEWLSIRNNIVRPTVADLKSKGKASTKYSQPALDKPLDFVPEPMKLPPENPVEFAPEPIGTAYWPVRPLRTEDKDWHVVSYRFGPGRNDFVRGRNTAREFYASRGVDRLHAAIDLYGNAGDQVVAIQDGIFLYAIVNFLGDTSAMYIQHTIDQPKLIFVYGEVAKYSWTTFNLKIGDKVKAGQVIAKLGITPGGSSMLHCETWALEVTGIKNRLHSSFRSWKKGGNPPKYVLNPTKYLLAVRKQELERRKQQQPQQQSSMSNTYKPTINESLIPNESESFLGPIISDVRGSLMWGKEYDTVSSAYRDGIEDENRLTNLIFFSRHPELNKSERLKPHQKELIKEWLNIRDKIVRPIVSELKKLQSQTERPSKRVEEPIPDYIKRWYKYLDQVTSRNTVIPLIDGKKAFESMAEAIRTATGKGHFIYFANWKMELSFNLIPTDEFSTLFYLIKQKDMQGVEIRALLSADLLGNNEYEGYNVTMAHTMLFGPLIHGSAIYDKNLLPLGVHHQKILIVNGSKGLIAFCGGIDFAANRLDRVDRKLGSRSTSEGSEYSQHDVHCRIEGPAAYDLLYVFINRWKDHPQKPTRNFSLLGESIQRPVGTGKSFVSIGTTFGNGNKTITRANEVKEQIKRIKNLATIVGSAVGILGGLLARRQVSNMIDKYKSDMLTEIKSGVLGKNVYNFAQTGSRSAYYMIDHAIQQAKKYIYIEDQYLINLFIAKELNLQMSKNKDLKVIILTSDSRITTDLFAPFSLRAKFIKTLTGNTYPNKQVAICYRKVDKPHNYVHAKTWIFDDEFTIIGSANCNNRGYTHDSEVVAGIYGVYYDKEIDPWNHNLNFASALRMRLWSEHLQKKIDNLTDLSSSIDFWFDKVPANALIRHIPTNDLSENDAGITSPIARFMVSSGQIDPRGD
jgi:phosphatidylserine/phosphatidylglycerophosphate/cardiolipin synthase-like enzyme/murein DD-endopeptidase MepM/ murein hydrolase activator NlpD